MLSHNRFSFYDLQDNGLVPIVEPEVLLDGDHSIDRTLEVAEKVWNEVFYFLAKNNVTYEGILLKPSMVTPGADSGVKKAPEVIAEYTLKLLRRRVPPAVPGIMVLLFSIHILYLLLVYFSVYTWEFYLYLHTNSPKLLNVVQCVEHIPTVVFVKLLTVVHCVQHILTVVFIELLNVVYC